MTLVFKWFRRIGVTLFLVIAAYGALAVLYISDSLLWKLTGPIVIAFWVWLAYRNFDRWWN